MVFGGSGELNIRSADVEEGLDGDELYLISLLMRCNPLMVSQLMRMRCIRLHSGLLDGEKLAKCPTKDSMRREGEGEAVMMSGCGSNGY